MKLKSLATIPTATLAGIVAPLGYRALERFDPSPSTRATPLVAYLLVSVVPFLVCVIGFDRNRWDGNYWFSNEGRIELRRTWIRWGAYLLGVIVGNVL